MAESSALNRNLYALLIGIDCYLPNRLPEGISYPSLGGCVRDINHVENFLKNRLGLAGDQIIKLTASNAAPGAPPPEPRKQWPTYKNMVAAFRRITEAAKPGEQVYVHYSGHGGRSITAFPKLKGEKGLDESFVPTDIGDSEARYLRDVEIAHLVRAMTDKGLLVTLVFDSCHSGGATRGGTPGAAVRGIAANDTTPPPTDSLVGTAEELELTWRAAPPEATRGAQLGAGWFPQLPGSVLLAACRANELANEFPFEGTESNGALTYWLLDSLKQLGPNLTFDMLHDRVLAKVHAKFPLQTPQLHGDGARVVFDTGSVPRPHSARVIEVDRTRRRVKIEAGLAQGVGEGARFAIYAADTTDFNVESARLAIAEAAEVKATETLADVVEPSNLAGVEEGAQAVQIDAGAARFEGRVRTVRRADLPTSLDQDGALQRVERELTKRGWVRLAEEGEAADFQVAVNFEGEFEVWEPSGRVIGNLRPPLKTGEPASASKLVDRLVHLTKYTNVKLIENTATVSPLARRLELTVAEEKAKGPGGEIVLDDGEHLTLVVRNTSGQALNITILDMQPDWGIAKLYPPDADSELLDAGAQVLIPLEFDLPEGYKEGRETIKVFATVGNTSFDWLQLPALDQPALPRQAKRSAGNALEKLMADFAADAPPEGLKRASLLSALIQWATAQTEIVVRRRVLAPPHVRDPSTSLLQAAFEEAAEEQQKTTRGGGVSRGGATTRASVSDLDTNAVAAYFADPTADAFSSARERGTRGALDTVKYCADMARGMASEAWNAHVRGNRAEYDAYKKALTARFGDCDPRFADALKKYMEFLLRRGSVPYRPCQNPSDFVIDDRLPERATIGLVADWGTGQPEALQVLEQVKRQKPDVAIHLGDIYYAGTASEVENYFYRPWQKVLQPETSGITSLVLAGNHDLYAGGQPFYDLLDRIGQPASFFCLRNKHWQLIGLDTALHDQLGGPPTSLEPTELEWLRDKVQNAGGRRTVLLSHHQLFSTNEQFGESKLSYNPILKGQVGPLLPQVDLWLWGHEHDLVIFGEHLGLKRGRCIGGSAFPVGKYEMPDVQKNPEVPFNKDVVLNKGAAFYQHCYAVMRLDGPSATVDYYEDSDGGRRLFTETL
ncbi:MAG: metallophosphoesterase [Pyrinomonadaceae bacterium]